MEDPVSPFPFGKVAWADTFIDRSPERKRLATNARSRVNTALISPRRWGKTSLVRQVAHDLRRDRKVRFCFIDLFKVRTEQAFFETLAAEVVRATSDKWEERLRTVKEFLKNLVPFIQFGTEPTSEITLNIRWEDLQRSKDDILALPERIAGEKGITLVICIDEFQNVERFDDPLGFQKYLRATWQHQRHVAYWLYGSKRHLMMDIFTRYDMPFYRFGDLMMLEKIGRAHWVAYLQERFQSGRKTISPELADRLAATMDDHPYGVQQLAYGTFIESGKRCTGTDIDNALQRLLDHHGMLYQRIVDDLSNPQLNYLRALLAGEPKPSSKEALRYYGLGTSGNVTRVKAALQDKDLLDLTGKEPEWLDPLFRIWLRERYWTAHELRPLERPKGTR